MHDRPLIDRPRLTDHAATPDGVAVFRGIADDWSAGLADRLAALRAASPAEAPGLLHELRSGATAIGMPALAAAAAALEQAAERGTPPGPEDLDRLSALAHRSSAAVREWWAAPPAPGTPR